MTLGNLSGVNVAETRHYNNRLQVDSIAAGGFSMVNCYVPGQPNCSGVTGMVSGNNGNVQGQVINSAARSYCGAQKFNRSSRSLLLQAVFMMQTAENGRRFDAVAFGQLVSVRTCRNFVLGWFRDSRS